MNHVSAGAQSKYLCERLFEELEKRLGSLKYEQGEDKCSIRGKGRVFALVNNHIKNYGSINIWFLGSADDARHFSELTIYKRTNSDSVKGAEPYRHGFNIRNEKQLLEAVEFLSTISYSQSLD